MKVIQRNCVAYLKLRNWQWWRLFTKVGASVLSLQCHHFNNFTKMPLLPYFAPMILGCFPGEAPAAGHPPGGGDAGQRGGAAQGEGETIAGRREDEGD